MCVSPSFTLKVSKHFAGSTLTHRQSVVDTIRSSPPSQLCPFVCWLIEADSASSYEDDEHTSSIGWSRSIDENTETRDTKSQGANNNEFVVDEGGRLRNTKRVQGECVEYNGLESNAVQTRKSLTAQQQRGAAGRMAGGRRVEGSWPHSLSKQGELAPGSVRGEMEEWDDGIVV